MDKKHLSILNDIAELRELQAFVEQLTNTWNLPVKIGMNLNLVLEEIVSIIIFYGYDDDDDHRIDIEFIHDGSILVVNIKDDAKAFDVVATEDFKDTDATAENRKIGGLGIHFVKSLMDKVEYSREEEHNILTLTKKI